MISVQAFADDEVPARALAAALGAPFGLIDLRTFPDGELLPTTPPPTRTVLAYRSLHHPNEKLIGLLLAVDAWRRAGVERLVLVAPYLCYLRQDAVFAAGQPLSRDVMGELLGPRFHRIVTVEAHLHRTLDLAAVFGTQAQSLSSAEPLAQAIGPSDPPPLLVGPDSESAAWVAALAVRLGAETLVFRKVRLDDRNVRLEADDLGRARGRRVVIVDDVCSSGGTLIAAAQALRGAGAASIEVAVAHALFDAGAERRLHAEGVSRIVSTDSVPHPTNAAPLAPLLARALTDEIPR